MKIVTKNEVTGTDSRRNHDCSFDRNTRLKLAGYLNTKVE